MKKLRAGDKFSRRRDRRKWFNLNYLSKGQAVENVRGKKFPGCETVRSSNQHEFNDLTRIKPTETQRLCNCAPPTPLLTHSNSVVYRKAKIGPQFL